MDDGSMNIMSFSNAVKGQPTGYDECMSCTVGGKTHTADISLYMKAYGDEARADLCMECFHKFLFTFHGQLVWLLDLEAHYKHRRSEAKKA